MEAYLDHSATTPLDPRVRMAMQAALEYTFGNSSSRDHRWGWDAADAIEAARGEVATLARVAERDVIFTSGSTESLNTIIRSYLEASTPGEQALITCATEHDAVLSCARQLARRTGTPMRVLPVDSRGRLDLDRLRSSLADVRSALVVLMAANNEIGTRHPVGDIAMVAHAAGASFLCDTTQAFGRCSINLRADGIDFATVSAHKMYGPKGAGALVMAPAAAAQVQPLVIGGNQERGLRGGTLNVPAIVGFGEACRLAVDEAADETHRVERLRNRLEAAVIERVERVWVNGDSGSRLCNITNMGFKGIDARTMIRDMHDIAVSTRSACSSGDSRPSHVLKAIGLSDEDAFSCIRFSLGRFTTQEEIDYTIEKVVTSAHKLRKLKSLRAN